jgi:transcription antitermination factor NusG
MRDTPVPEMQIIKEGWVILLCEPNRELVAVSGLTARGFECCCPCDYFRKPTGKRDQNGRPVLSMEATPKALVPGYVFLKMAGTFAEYHAVKAVKGVSDFYKIERPGRLDPAYAAVQDAELVDLRQADALAFEKFQAAVLAQKKKEEQALLPKEKRTPDVAFEKNKVVRVFSTKLGKEVHGAMQQKRGDGMVQIMVDNISMLVPHVDVLEMERAS